MNAEMAKNNLLWIYSIFECIALSSEDAKVIKTSIQFAIEAIEYQQRAIDGLEKWKDEHKKYMEKNCKVEGYNNV